MIMDHFIEDKAESEIFSNLLKKQAGFGKNGEKGFDGAITTLMMQLYLCNCDFRKRVNKKGEVYGWDVAVYSSPEQMCIRDRYPSAAGCKPRYAGFYAAFSGTPTACRRKVEPGM